MLMSEPGHAGGASSLATRHGATGDELVRMLVMGMVGEVMRARRAVAPTPPSIVLVLARVLVFGSVSRCAVDSLPDGPVRQDPFRYAFLAACSWRVLYRRVVAYWRWPFPLCKCLHDTRQRQVRKRKKKRHNQPYSCSGYAECCSANPSPRPWPCSYCVQTIRTVPGAS